MKTIIGISMVILAITIFACQNENVDTQSNDELFEKSAQITLTEVQLEAVTTETEYEIEFYANAEETLTRWWRIGKVWRWTHKLRYRMNHCPDVSIETGDNDGYPKIITLNYGDGTELNNGKVLSGEIVVEISAPKMTGEYTRLVSFNDFGIDTLLISGSSLVTVNKENENFKNYESNFTFTFSNGFSVERISNRTWTWVEGFDTKDDQTDDVIEIEGEVEAENSNGDTYKKKIVEPLIRLGDCRYIVQGVVEITLNGILVSSLDYGDGECDNIAIMTVDSETVEIDLAKRQMKGKKHKEQENGNQHYGKG